MAGCGKSSLLNLSLRIRTIKSSGKNRSYLAHVPSGYDKNHQYPVIFGFHGAPGVGFFFEADTGLDLAKYSGDKILVYPDGFAQTWAGPSNAQTTVEEDLQFIWDMLADLRSNFCVDNARIYATGMSRGGGFVDTIACNATVGGEFAAFAVASGAFYTNDDVNHQNCKPARVPTPMLEFHGGADTIVPYEGGEGRNGGLEPSIPNWLKWWAERNECDEPHTEEDSFNGEVHHLSWTCKGQEDVLQHWKQDKQKHDWPSKWPNFSQIVDGDFPGHLEGNELIISFFSNYTRPAG